MHSLCGVVVSAVQLLLCKSPGGRQDGGTTAHRGSTSQMRWVVGFASVYIEGD